MIRTLIISCLCIFSAPAAGETVVAVRTIKAQEVILASDVKLVVDAIPGMASSLADVTGMEARRILYAGRPISSKDLGPIALVDRNEIVLLAYGGGGLTIRTEGRALARGGSGDRIRVINLDSRTTVTGKIDENGTVWVGH